MPVLLGRSRMDLCIRLSLSLPPPPLFLLSLPLSDQALSPPASLLPSLPIPARLHLSQSPIPFRPLTMPTASVVEMPLQQTLKVFCNGVSKSRRSLKHLICRATREPISPVYLRRNDLIGQMFKETAGPSHLPFRLHSDAGRHRVKTHLAPPATAVPG